MANSTLSEGGTADAVRLRAISNATDEPTRAVLGDLISANASAVLDLGAGNGSVARWVARTYSGARVVALDRDTTLLEAEPVPGNCAVVRADIADYAPEPASFDLVHARFVLAHLVGRDDLLARASQWVRPGGHLVVTEAHTLGVHSLYPVAEEVLGAYERYCAAAGFDLTWARRIPGVMLRNELRVVDVRTVAGRLGGGPGVDRWHALIERVADELVRGGLEPAALDGFAALCADPDVYDVPQVIVTVVGRRPVQPG